MYVNPQAIAVAVDGQALEVDDQETQQQFDEFYEDVWAEMSNFGEIEEMHVTGNLGDHLSGNLYVKFSKEDEAVNALTKLQGRFYAGRPILGEYSPVTDFREARCRQYDVGECTRGGFCNFIHECKPSKDLVRDLYRSQRKKFRSRSRYALPFFFFFFEYLLTHLTGLVRLATRETAPAVPEETRGETIGAMTEGTTEETIEGTTAETTVGEEEMTGEETTTGGTIGVMIGETTVGEEETIEEETTTDVTIGGMIEGITVIIEITTLLLNNNHSNNNKLQRPLTTLLPLINKYMYFCLIETFLLSCSCLELHSSRAPAIRRRAGKNPESGKIPGRQMESPRIM